MALRVLINDKKGATILSSEYVSERPLFSRDSLETVLTRVVPSALGL